MNSLNKLAKISSNVVNSDITHFLMTTPRAFNILLQRDKGFSESVALKKFK